MNQLYFYFTFALACFNGAIIAQPVPASEENIPHLVTFGKMADKWWGDDDFSQVFFFVLPAEQTKSIFIRVFDPSTSGKIDELKGEADTRTLFAVYGGKGTITDKDSRNIDPKGNYKAGNQLAKKIFYNEDEYDGKWYTFGPFNPSEGELSPKYGGRVFKLICEGVTGDDGNLYNYFLSTSPTENIAVEGGNAFTFEYSFRLHDDPTEISHIYPYIDDRVISIKQANFDWDDDGYIRIISPTKPGISTMISKNNLWAHQTHKIDDEEKGGSLDIQFVKNTNLPALSNNVVFSITNQYGELLPFYTIPIGGIPKYNYQIGFKNISAK